MIGEEITLKCASCGKNLVMILLKGGELSKSAVAYCECGDKSFKSKISEEFMYVPLARITNVEENEGIVEFK